jgi:hypothetical protein
MKFEDLDGDGVKDAGEPGLGGWTIRLTGTDSRGNAVNSTAITSSNVATLGAYSFTNVWASGGTGYTLSEDLLTVSWNQTYPTSGTYNVVVTSGNNVTCKDFGNVYVPPTITGGGPAPMPSLTIAGITTEKHKVAGLQIAGITELPFTGSNMLIVYAIAILMIASGTAILSTTKKIRKNRA